MEFAALAFRFALACVFLLAGLAKLPRRAEFEQAVRRYSLLPSGLIQPVAIGLPPLELAGGLLLAVGFGTVLVALVLAGLLTVFAGAVAINLVRGRDIDCGCFSTAVPRRISWPAVGRNLALAVMALVVATNPSTALSADGFLSESGSGTLSTDAAIAVLILSTVALAAVSLVGQTVRLRALVTALDGAAARTSR